MDGVDYKAGSTFRCGFNTIDSNGALVAPTGTLDVRVYKDDSTSPISTGITVTENFVTSGRHRVKIVLSDSVYAVGSYFEVAVSSGSADGVSQVGMVVGAFTIGRHAYPDANDLIQVDVKRQNAIVIDGSGILADPFIGVP